MSEQLLIRLASSAEQTVHWLIWSDAEAEIIASGSLDNAAALSELSDKAQQRQVVILLPAADVSFHQLELAKAAQRSWQQVAPFMLEEQLAEDPEQLHIVLAAKNKQGVQVACLSHQQMELWQEQLEQAGLHSNRWLIDALCLPAVSEAQVSAVQLEQQWLLRFADDSVAAIEQDWLDVAMPALVAQYSVAEKENAESEQESADEPGVESVPSMQASSALQIRHYSSAPKLAENEQVEWQAQVPELPLKLLAEGIKQNKLNLLQGAYQAASPWLKYWRVWRKVAIAAAISFTIALGHQVLEWQRVESQQAQVQEHIRSVYKKVFPDVRRVRDSAIRRDFNRALDQLDQPQRQDFMGMVLKVAPPFDAIPSLDMQTLRYDQARHELRMQIEAESYQDFEKFREGLKPLESEQGTLSKKGDKVVGTITVRKAS